MPIPLPPAGGPIDDADSPMEARRQIRANIIDINPDLDIDGCKWVRASEVTVQRGTDDCKVTCGAYLQCRFTTSGPKSVIVVTGTLKAPSECDVVSVAIDGVNVPFTKYRANGVWRYETYNEWLYTGEITFPLCEYVNVAVTTSCGDVCTYKFHSCAACYNAQIWTFPATTVSRSYTYTIPQFNGSTAYTVTETLTVPSMVFSSVRNSQCARTDSLTVDVDNAYLFEMTAVTTFTGTPLAGQTSYYRVKIYDAGVRFSYTGSVNPRGNCKRDLVITYPSGVGNVNLTGQTVCWANGGGGGVGTGTCSSGTVGPGKMWVGRPSIAPLDICGDTQTVNWDIYPRETIIGPSCWPYLDLGRVFQYSHAPPSWSCGTYSSQIQVTSV
jgi:hypothetical protein